MTGYGKAETTLAGKKYTIEIRSVNGKTADIGFKTSQVPREHELQLRKELTERLHRGNIDLLFLCNRNKSFLKMLLIRN